MKETVWEIEDPSEKPAVRKEASVTGAGKSPALAFSLSILLWGGGQFYTGYWIEGAVLFLLMVGFYSFTALEIFFRNSDSLKSFVLPLDNGAWLPVFIILYFSGLAIWLFGAVRAYFIAVREREERYNGVSNVVFPGLCSLIVPGWGQFLNGQAKKGFFFLLMGFIGFFSAGAIPAILLFWDRLGQSTLKGDIEWLLAGCLLISPIVLIVWILGAYDALRVSMDDVKKEPWIMRMGYALNRMKLKGWKGTVIPRLKILSIFLVCLSLALLIAYRYLPASFYKEEMVRARNEFKARQMTVLPNLIDGALKKAGDFKVTAKK